MSEHAWVKIQYLTLNNVYMDDNGVIQVQASREAQIAAEEEANFGCWLCEIPLNKDTLNSTCAGHPHD